MSLNDLRVMYGPWGAGEIADYLSIRRATVDKWQTRGVLPHPRYASGRPYWWPDEIDDWAEHTGRIPTFEILLSDGSEEIDADPAWGIVDDKDSFLHSVGYRAGETITQAVGRLSTYGRLPPVRPAKARHEGHPYSWQMEPTRWVLEQIRIPRSAEEWAAALNALTDAAGKDAPVEDGSRACWVPFNNDRTDRSLLVAANSDWFVELRDGSWEVT